MAVLVLLIPISLLLIGVAGGMFIWAVNHGQFEELDRHGFDILEDSSGDNEE